MRLPDLTPAELGDAQRALREQILGGPRGNGPQHFPLVHAGRLADRPVRRDAPRARARRPAAGARDRGPLRAPASRPHPRDRDPGRRARHRQRVRGIRPRSASGGPPDSPTTSWPRSPTAPSPRRDPVEHAAHGSAGGCSDAGPGPGSRHRLRRRYAATLGTTTITELVVLVGYYRTLAQLLDVFDVGVPDE